MQYRNPTFTADGAIDCEIEHSDFGWIPFTASPDDPEPLGAQVFNAAKDSAAPYIPLPEPTPEELLAQARENRAFAYTEEADPIFFKYQRGEATEQEWLDKTEEIRARYPYPVE